MHIFHKSLLFAAAVQAVTAQSTPSPEELAALTTAYEAAQRAAPDFSFYESFSNFSDGLAPGTILHIEAATNLTNYTVPSGLSMSRIVYTTLDVHGSVVPTSAFILWPYTPLSTSEDGFATALWAHGTSGVFQTCAPSNYRGLQYNFMVPFLLAEQGITVVAPDYQGLGVGSFANGTTIRHPWATSPSNANDMAYALTAARAAFPQYLTQNGSFVAMGHSEGGRTAWGFAQRQAHDPVPGYKGTIAFAPSGDTIEQLEEALEHSTESWAANTIRLQPFLIDAVTAVYPAYKHGGFTETVRELFNVYKRYQGCLPTETVLLSGLPLDELARPGWYNNTYVRMWQNLTTVGRQKFAGPLLVIIGSQDGITSYNDTVSSSLTSIVRDTCELMKDQHWEESLELIGYNAMAHFPVIQASQSKWLAWVKDRLTENGSAPIPKRCAMSEEPGFRTEYTYQGGPPYNWLLGWVNRTYAWEYTL